MYFLYMQIVSYNVALCPVLRGDFENKIVDIINFINNDLNNCDVICLQETTGTWDSPCIPYRNRCLSSLSVFFGNCIPVCYSTLRERIIAECKKTFPYSFESEKIKKCNKLFCGNEYYDSGLLILSKHSIKDKECINYLENIDVGQKGLLKCKINGVTVVNTHLIPSNYGNKLTNFIRENQLDQIRECTKFDSKIIIAGDMNIDSENRKNYDYMLYCLSVSDASIRNNITYWADTEVLYDDKKLDYFLTRGLETENYRVIDTYISDHKPIVVEIIC